MKIAVAGNHMGFKVKQDILVILKQLQCEAIDLGPFNDEICDYPDYAALAARAVINGDVDRAILVGGTGIGLSITANKFPGIRAALCYDELTVRISRLQHDANILCLSANIFRNGVVAQHVKTWLETEFEGGHHARKLAKISEIEKDRGRRPATSENGHAQQKCVDVA